MYKTTAVKSPMFYLSGSFGKGILSHHAEVTKDTSSAQLQEFLQLPHHPEATAIMQALYLFILWHLKWLVVGNCFPTLKKWLKG